MVEEADLEAVPEVVQLPVTEMIEAEVVHNLAIEMIVKEVEAHQGPEVLMFEEKMRNVPQLEISHRFETMMIAKVVQEVVLAPVRDHVLDPVHVLVHAQRIVNEAEADRVLQASADHQI